MNEWRTSITAEDYFLHQQKRQAIDGRRPLIRKASDLVGPGIAEYTIRITDFSDPLATVNGFFSSEPGARDAPNNTDQFVGRTISDDEMGGWQRFRSLQSGLVYDRAFRRTVGDASFITFGLWSVGATTNRTWVSLALAGYTGSAAYRVLNNGMVEFSFDINDTLPTGDAAYTSTAIPAEYRPSDAFSDLVTIPVHALPGAARANHVVYLSTTSGLLRGSTTTAFTRIRGYTTWAY